MTNVILNTQRIDEVEYHAPTKTLVVHQTDGRRLLYSDIPQQLYLKMILHLQPEIILYHEIDGFYYCEELLGEPTCANCGCTDHNPCFTGAGVCHWITPKLCSECCNQNAKF